MRLDITGRHMDITAPLRQLIEKRFGRLERVLNDAAVSATVTLSKEKYRLRTELAVHTRGDHVLRGNGESNGWAVSVRQATDKIEQQAQTLKGKWNERKRKGARAARQVDDGALRLESGKDAFLVFRNSDTESVSILYRRKDGNLSLIEPD